MARHITPPTPQQRDRIRAAKARAQRSASSFGQVELFSGHIIDLIIKLEEMERATSRDNLFPADIATDLASVMRELRNISDRIDSFYIQEADKQYDY